MPLVPTSELVAETRQSGRGIAAFNVITLEHAEAVATGAERAGASAILQISENAVRFRGGRLGPVAAATRAVARDSAARLSLHLDHVRAPELFQAALDEDFGSVMFDASQLDYAANVAATADAVRRAHARDVWVEAELGQVGGKEGEEALDAHAPGARTDPGEAADYVTATGVDGLAVAVGSSHAMTARTASLDHELIAELRKSVDVPLVLHGSSGVPDAEIARAVAAGMVKVNVGTALNTAFSGAVREHLSAHPYANDPRKYLAPGREAMAETVAGFLRVIAG